MIATDPKIFNSLEEVYSRMDDILREFTENGIFVFRGLNLNDEEHADLVKTLGDAIGWYPNSKSVEMLHKYEESHSNNSLLDTYDGDQIILEWHLEHVELDGYIPLVAGIWNMKKFTCSPESGKTYFSDSMDAYLNLEKSEIDFLLLCKISWLDEKGTGPYSSPIVAQHWLTGKPLIRLELLRDLKIDLIEFNGNQPNEKDLEKFYSILEKIRDRICNHSPSRIVHRWQEGDIVMPDLQRMAHAVTGGFIPSERKFRGLWAFSKDPEKLLESEWPPSWKIQSN